MTHRTIILGSALLLLTAITAFAQDSTTANSGKATVRGCLDRNRGNYVVVEDKTNLAYVLRGVGSSLDGLIHHEVEVTGQLHPGSMKTGSRSTKDGSNPSDTVHGVDGTPLQVADVKNDIKDISKKCKAAEDQ